MGKAEIDMGTFPTLEKGNRGRERDRERARAREERRDAPSPLRIT